MLHSCHSTFTSNLPNPKGARTAHPFLIPAALQSTSALLNPFRRLIKGIGNRSHLRIGQLLRATLQL